MADQQSRKDVGELSLAFQSNDLTKMVELTKGLPVRARGSLRSIVEVYQKRRCHGMTPLISAILHDNEHVAEMLIKEPVDMGQHLGKGFRRITDLLEMEAIYFQANLEIIHGPTNGIFKGFCHTTPMFWALKTNNLRMVEKILNCSSFEKNSLVEKMNGMPALMLAAVENNIPACQVLLKYNVDLHVADFSGGKALDVAIERELDDMIRFLLTVGESANCTKHNQPLLMLAIDQGSLRVMEVLIEKGANVQLTHFRNSTIRPLHYAVGSLKFKEAKFLVKKGADVNSREDNRITALQLLASLKLEGPHVDKIYDDVIDMAKFLVAHKSDVNAKNSRNETALHSAVNCINVKLVKYLLSVNCQVNTKNHSLQTPLHSAIIPSNATKAVVTVTPQTEISRHSEGGFTVNTPYIVPNQKEVVNLLIQAGAEINSKDCNLHTPLFLAVGNNNLQMVELLINLGAEVNGKNIDGLALLHFATRENNLNIVKCLIDVGKVSVDVTSKTGETPLHIAVVNKNIDIVECLISAKANVTVKNCLKATPIMLAAGNNSSKLVKLLAKAGADVNTQNEEGASLLHLSIAFKHRKLIKSLLELGADVNLKDEHGVSPFMICIIDLDRESEFIQLLLDYGGDPLYRYRGGLTVYQCAIARHAVDILKMFWRHGCPIDESEREIYSARKDFKIETSRSNLWKNKRILFSSSILITEEEKVLRTAQLHFMEGIVKGHPKQVADAIKNGAVARGVSRSMPYPLHYAVRNGYQDVTEVLLTNGVPANSVDDNRNTPLQIAALAGDLDMCFLLLTHGACYCSGLGDKDKELEKSVHKLNGNASSRLKKKRKELKKLKKSHEVRQINKEFRQMEKEVDRCIKEHDKASRALKKDAKFMKVAVDNLQSCSLKSFFFTISKLFLMVRKRDRYDNEMPMLLIEESVVPFRQALLNCVDNTGKTLMGVTIETGNVKMTEYLMNHRLCHGKISASD